MEALFEHARSLGFRDIFLWTVPPSVDSRRVATIGFYEKHGFTIEKEYKELWQDGALQMRKLL
jgi:ribosomal protein S18 acetylase RimI-like enzyme